MVSVIQSHQLLGFTPNHIVSQKNNVTNVRRNASTGGGVIELPTTGIESSFVGSCKVRQSLRKFPSYLSNSRSKSSHICKSQLAVQDFAPVASAGYAVLLLGGGLFAYNKSGSKGSLFGGLTGAVLMSAAYYLMQSPETKELGDAVAFGASLLFAVIFGIRFANTGKLVPAGLLLAVSISITALTYSAYLHDKI
ncbi:protein FATTY ACID EXPORT 4, chloroplastic [Rutidosis leptorrhynchoides]|uniref:protein FATTY ACID EXPORT 4, chloroplastic n=1 Tax=Rutidosis leptorrhynchoides TaxID=125765 RepID=UPI003A9997F5